MPIFAITVFLSAFLLFSIQPMIAKFLLPSFGGTAAVWATCLVVFQTLLLAGYAYAHLLRIKLSPTRQRWVHLGVLAVSLLFLPPKPTVHLAADPSVTPVWELLRCLFTSVGVPFFALSATAPLLMEWFRQSFPTRPPDRLYAFSNAGSLLALISYPFLLEANFTRTGLSQFWAGGLGVFFLVCLGVAWKTRAITPAVNLGKSSRPSHPTPAAQVTPNRSGWLWVALSAVGSGLLLALTNQISQDVAPMPLLWVAPMAVYLVTFILCFESQRFYRRTIFMPACFVALIGLAWLLKEGYLLGFWPQVGSYLAVLFCGCMVCHGELYRLRPAAERLTAYYLAISLGGALGGIFVALVAPVVFKTLLETSILASGIASLVAIIVWQERAKVSNWKLASAAAILVIASHTLSQRELRQESIHYARNFYGAYRVTESPLLRLGNVSYPLINGTARVLHSGQIYHGLQFTNTEAATIATTYYSTESGLGLVFRNLPASTNRHIGAIGLGVGTIASYAQAGDRVRFYELNPAVLKIAETHFTVLSRSAGDTTVVLGDGRLSLEREAKQEFDLLILDAFAGDSIPMHLLTEEAMRGYVRHLKPTGVMAFHVSNSHLDLEPIVRALARQHGFRSLLIPPQMTAPETGKLASMWMLLSANESFFRLPEIANTSDLTFGKTPLLWTDDHSSILPILR